MNAMVLCSGCKRHVFAGETACPFCGIGFGPAPERPILPQIAPELSRAQRYVVGAAIAASVATAGCSSPTVVHNPDEAGNTTVDLNNTQSDRNARESLEVAQDPNDSTLTDEERALRRAREDRERMEREREMGGNRGHRTCVNGNCPPYGCVFPDEACDVVRV